MMRNEFDIVYDRAVDILYVTFVPGVDASSDESAPGVLWRHAVDGGEIVGVTILDFEHYWRPRMDELVNDISLHLSLKKNDAKKILESIH